MTAGWCRTRRRRRLAAAAGVILLSAAASGCFWQQPGYGPEHARYNPSEDTLTTDNVASLAETWQVEFPGTYVSEPLISGGRVFLTARDMSTTMTNASVRALRLASGTPIWETPVEVDQSMSLASPVAFSGDALWSTHMDPTASPCPASLTGLDPADGHLVASESVNVPDSDLVTSGAVAAYVASAGCGAWEGPSTLVVRDSATRMTQWTADLPGPVGAAPRISDGVIYVLSGTTLRAFAADGCGASTCAPLWAAALRNLENEVLLDLVVADGRVFVASTVTIDDPWHQEYVQGAVLNVYAADTGSFLWERTYFGSYDGGRGGAAIHSIAVDDTSVFVAASIENHPDGGIDTIDAYPVEGCGTDSCPPTWSGELSNSVRTAALAVGGGVVYAAFKLPTPDAVSVLTAFDAGGCGESICSVLMSAPVTGWPRAVSLAQGTLLVASDGLPGNTSVLTAFRPTV